jgi:LDH2 family malate/lactate/ureidoglycolate dehydrogenase
MTLPELTPSGHGPAAWQSRVSAGVRHRLALSTGHLLWVVGPVGLHGDGAAAERAAEFQQRLRRTVPAQGTDAVLSPGDREHRHAAAHTEQVPLPTAVLDDLRALAEELDVRGRHELAAGEHS